MTRRYCADPVNLFGPWDDYAQMTLLSQPLGCPVLGPLGIVVGYELGEYRYDLLKLFFVSLAWRASVSTRPLFQNVNLGPYEDKAKTLLQANNPGDAQDFGVILAKYHPHVLAEAIVSPYEKRMDSINYVRFCLGGYIAYIKTDQRNVPNEFTGMVLTRGKPLKVLMQDPNQ